MHTYMNSRCWLAVECRRGEDGGLAALGAVLMAWRRGALKRPGGSGAGQSGCGGAEADSCLAVAGLEVP